MKNREPDLEKLYRFDRSRNAFQIDIALDTYTDVYNEWDYAPFRRRDVDHDLMAYLEECSHEIPLRYAMAINFFLPKDVYDPAKEDRSITGLRNYLRYELQKTQANRRRILGSLLMYVSFGLTFLVAAYAVQTLVSGSPLLGIVPEGLFIGGWVLFWEAFSILFFSHRDVMRRIREYRRLARASITYIYKDRQSLENAY